MTKFKIGDQAFSWEAVPHGRVQFEGTVVYVFSKEQLSKTQEETLVVLEEKTQLATRFHILEESHVHKNLGVTYATDPDNQLRFDAMKRDHEKLITKKHG